MRAALKWIAAPFRDVDWFDLGVVFMFAALMMLCLVPIVERAEAVFAFFDMIETMGVK